MKIKYIINVVLILLLSVGLSYSQVSNGFNYQAVARDNAGDLIKNTAVDIRFNIFQGSSSVYNETISTSTNDFGLFNVVIGEGSTSFGTIDWGNGSHLLQVELSVNGGAFQDLGTTELRSVPYAEYAKNQANSVWFRSGNNIYYNSGRVGIGTNNPSEQLDVNGKVRIVDIPRFNTNDPIRVVVHDSTNNQVLKWIPASILVGPVGPMGPMGPMGPKGDKGKKGDKGDKGKKGDKGDKGKDAKLGVPGKDLIVRDIDSNIVFIVWAATGNSKHFGVETFLKGIKVPTTDGGNIALMPDGTITMYDSTDKIINQFTQDSSYHAKPEHYAGGIKIPAKNGGRIALMPDGTITMYDSTDKIINQFTQDSSYHAKPEYYVGGIIIPSENGGRIKLMPDGTITMYDSTDKIINQFTQDSSYHAKPEHYAGGIKIPAKNGGRIALMPDGTITMYDSVGNIITEFGPDGSYHALPETYAGGINIPFYQGGWLEILPNGTMTMYGPDGTITNQFTPFGSYHAGYETYASGIDIPLSNGGMLHFCTECGIVIWGPDGLPVYEVQQDGTSFHWAPETFAGGIIAWDGPDGFPSIQAGSIFAESIFAEIKLFRIDHPLDPENKYLYHTSVESSNRMNIYNGNVMLDENGEAVVELENWFDALNADFTYQFTPIGAPAPNLYVAEEIKDNRFKIAGGKQGMKVSWQITGNRIDEYSKTHPLVLEAEKTEQDKERERKQAPLKRVRKEHKKQGHK